MSSHNVQKDYRVVAAYAAPYSQLRGLRQPGGPTRRARAPRLSLAQHPDLIDADERILRQRRNQRWAGMGGVTRAAARRCRAGLRPGVVLCRRFITQNSFFTRKGSSFYSIAQRNPCRPAAPRSPLVKFHETRDMPPARRKCSAQLSPWTRRQPRRSHPLRSSAASKHRCQLSTSRP